MSKIINSEENEQIESKEESEVNQKNEITVEKAKIPVVKYSRPPAFTKTNLFTKWKGGQNNNNTSIPRRSAGRWR